MNIDRFLKPWLDGFNRSRFGQRGKKQNTTRTRIERRHESQGTIGSRSSKIWPAGRYASGTAHAAHHGGRYVSYHRTCCLRNQFFLFYSSTNYQRIEFAFFFKVVKKLRSFTGPE